MSTQVTNIMGWLGAAIAAICFLPQVIRAFKYRSTKDLSLMMTIIIIIGNIIWIIYGIGLGSPQVWATNVCQLVFMIAILGLKLYNIGSKKEKFNWFGISKKKKNKNKETKNKQK